MAFGDRKSVCKCSSMGGNRSQNCQLATSLTSHFLHNTSPTSSFRYHPQLGLLKPWMEVPDFPLSPRPRSAKPGVPLGPSSLDLSPSPERPPQTCSSSWVPHCGDNPTVSQSPSQMSRSHSPYSPNPSVPELLPGCASPLCPLLCPHRHGLAQASSPPTWTLDQPLPWLPELLFILTRPPQGLPAPRAAPAPPVVPQQPRTGSLTPEWYWRPREVWPSQPPWPPLS